MADRSIFDVAVVGAGPAGLITGLASAASGLETAVLGPLADVADGRTVALLDGSINLLKRLGLFEHLKADAEPLTAIRLIDATGALIRAPEVLFEACEIGLPAFGWSLANAGLTAALERAAQTRLTRVISDRVSVSDLHGDYASLSTKEGRTVCARLVVAADGRRSPTRTAAGISVTAWSYAQAALVTTFRHTRPHRGVSSELHRPSGPLTVVPGPGTTSSLVWVDTPSETERLAALDEREFARALAAHVGGFLGALSDFAPRRSYPLTAQTAATLARRRVALVGEAAHVMPPIGAQGLNLGFRDAAILAEIAGDAKGAGEDVGGDALLSRYDRLRRLDMTTRVLAVDMLNRSLLSSIPGVHFARGLGLFALSINAGLRARVMREGVMPAAAIPALMQPVQGETPSRAIDCRATDRA